MEIIVAFIFGVVAGILGMVGWCNHKAVYGYFSLKQTDPDDPELYNISISIPERLYLLDKKKIILRNTNESQK